MLRVGHSACADVSAGEPAGVRAQEAVAKRFQFFHVLLGDGVFPHSVVHAGGEDDRTGSGADEETYQVVGQAAGGFRQDVGGGRGDQHEVGLFRQRDVLRVGAVFQVERGGVDG